MNKIIEKKLITESIQGWFVLDNILFGGSPTVHLREHTDVLNTYNNLKKTFLKTVFEFYNEIGYKSSIKTMPKSEAEIESRAFAIMESLNRDLRMDFVKNEKHYSKVISEGVNVNNDKLLKKRTSYLGRSIMIENFFINKPLKYKSNRISPEKMELIKNCLTEVKQELLNISSKYYKHF